MKRFFSIALLLSLIASGATRAASGSMSAPMMGVGPHGFDYLTGSWSCINSVPSNIGGPATAKWSAARNAAGTISIRVTASNTEVYAYVAYDPKTKTWLNPNAYANGDYSFESTQHAGKTVRFTGSYFNAASGTSVPIRDTYTMLSASKQYDLNEAKVGGVWKTQGKTKWRCSSAVNHEF